MLFKAAGCVNCHSPDLGGSVALKTKFGVFYTPNISSSPANGIGAWSDGDFLRALREGISPKGYPYYPAFPYHAFSKMKDEDILAIKAYIFSLPPSERVNRQLQLQFPYNERSGLWIWRKFYFANPTGNSLEDMKMSAGPFSPDRSRSPEWNRGAYLVEAVAHCTECHTPRDQMGGLIESQWMAGNAVGPTGKRVPNISPDKQKGTGQWSKEDWLTFLETGLTPEGDAVSGDMDEVIQGLSGLSPSDFSAIADYMMSLPAAQEKNISLVKRVESLL